eukprot:1930196-Prymnesium_polylepis.1
MRCRGLARRVVAAAGLDTVAAMAAAAAAVRAAALVVQAAMGRTKCTRHLGTAGIPIHMADPDKFLHTESRATLQHGTG